MRKALSHTFDERIGRLLKNAGVLFIGNLVASALGLASMAITARALGVEQFGVLVLVTTYVLVVGRLVNFQSWQALIKYGAHALHQKRIADFKIIVKFGFFLDALSAVFGAVIAASGVWFFGKWRGWDEHLLIMASVYSLTILFHINSTPTAILRLFSRFSKIAWQNVITYSFLLGGVLLSAILEAGLWVFLIIWGLADIFGKLLILYFGFVELTRQKIFGIFSSSIKGISCKFKGIWSFVWATNVNSSLRSSIREVDILIIGAFLGPAGSGLFKIVKSAALVLGKIADPLYEAIYPETARLISAGRYREFRNYAIRSSLISGSIALVFMASVVLVGEQVIALILGEDYLASYMPMLVYISAYVIWMFAYPLSAAILSFGMPYVNLIVLVFSMIIYFPLFIYFLGIWGLTGASAATVAFYAFWAMCMLAVVIIAYKKRNESAST